MATDNGQATGSAELFLGYPPTAGIEVHVGNPPSVVLGDIATGVNPLPPSGASFVDPGVTPFSAGSALVNVNKTLTFGTTGATSTIVNPA